MNRDTYLRTAIGFGSSHPTFVAKRARYACLIAMLPLTIFLGWFGYKIRHAGNWTPMLDLASTWLIIAAVTLSFTTAAIATIALMTRLNRWRHVSKQWSLDHNDGLTSTRNDRPRVAPDWWILVPAVVIGFVGPFFAAVYMGSDDSSSLESAIAIWMFRSLAFFPLFALLSITGIGGDVVDDPNLERKRRGWLLLLSVCLGGIAVAFAMRDGLALVGNDSWAAMLSGYLPHVDALPSFVPSFVFGLGAMVALVAWRRWTTNLTSLQRKARNMMDPQRLTGLLSELAWSESRDSSVDESTQETAPQWLLPILSALRASDPTTSPSASDLHWLFAGTVSPETLASLQNAINAASRMTRSDEESRDHSIADAILMQDDDEEQIDVLVAFAVYQVLIRGQRVLWMIPDASDREAIGAVVDKAITRIGMSGLIHAGFVRSTSARDFDGDGTTVPQILLATSEHWRDFVWNNVTIDIDQRRRFIQAIHIICIGDLNSFAELQKAELESQLTGHRIINSTAGSYTQVAVRADSSSLDQAKRFLGHLSQGASLKATLPTAKPISLVEFLPPLTPIYPNTSATIERLGESPDIKLDNTGDSRSIAANIHRKTN